MPGLTTLGRCEAVVSTAGSGRYGAARNPLPAPVTLPPPFTARLTAPIAPIPPCPHAHTAPGLELTQPTGHLQVLLLAGAVELIGSIELERGGACARDVTAYTCWRGASVDRRKATPPRLEKPTVNDYPLR
ncbi:unnamed protein product, partial [Iphiclides podalirius]